MLPCIFIPLAQIGVAMELETIRSMIYEVRGVRVMLDFDLARLYQVENRTLKQAVRRNMDRFPDDFMLKLTKDEANRLISIGISQNVISSDYNPGPGQVFAFTEEGVAMLSAVLRSPVAVNVSIEIMRAFVEIRNHLATTGRLSVELAELRARMELLQRAGEENAEHIDEMSKELRRELDNVYAALSELAGKSEDKPVQRQKIGYVKENGGGKL